MLNLEVFGERLRQLRKENHMVLADVAKLLKTSTTQVGDMENGKSGTTMARLVLLAEYFHVSTDYLLGITDDPTWRGEPFQSTGGTSH